MLQVRGLIGKRPDEAINPELETGAIEVRAVLAAVLNAAKTTPLYISKEGGEDESLRLKYRYLDLRRERMQRNLVLRHRVVKFIRDFLEKRAPRDRDADPAEVDPRGRARLPGAAAGCTPASSCAAAVAPAAQAAADGGRLR